MRLNTFSRLGQISSVASIPTRSWACPRCNLSQLRVDAKREYSRLRKPTNVRIVKDRKRVNRIFYAIAFVSLAGGGYLLRDDIRHWNRAAVRTFRVVAALYVNIQEYVKTSTG